LKGVTSKRRDVKKKGKKERKSKGVKKEKVEKMKTRNLGQSPT